MHCFRSNLRLLAVSTVALLPVRAPAQVLAYIDSDSVTVWAFSQRYRDYLMQTPERDSLQARLDFLQGMVEDIICTRYGRDRGLYQELKILRAGRLAWREVLLRAVAQGRFVDEVTLSTDEIEAEYRYRNTALLTRYLTVRDRHAAVHYLQELGAGEPFESLALQASDSSALLDNPGELGWRFPRQLDSTYARHAYRLMPGQLSDPVRTTRGYQIIQLLGKEFRPDHGHFERVKHQQRIAAELRPQRVTYAAREALEQWSTSLPYKWRRWTVRKILRSGILENPPPVAAANPGELADEVLFILLDEPYSLDWVLSRLDLLLPEERAGVTSVKTLQNLVRRLFVWDHLLGLAASLPRADSLLAAANSRQAAVIHRAVKDSLHARLLRQVTPPEDSLRRFLADHREWYTAPALVNLEEIVVRDSALAVALRDSLLGRNQDFSALARRHSEREWARITGGRLGWVPTRIYEQAAALLVEATGRNSIKLVGPLKVGDYYILARPGGYRPAGMPPLETLQPRLRRDWIAANRQRLIREGMLKLQATTYPTFIDTNLIGRLQLDERGLLALPALPDSTGRGLNPDHPD